MNKLDYLINYYKQERDEAKKEERKARKEDSIFWIKYLELRDVYENIVKDLESLKEE